MESGIWDTEHGTIWNTDYRVWCVTYAGERMENGVVGMEYGL